MVQRLFAAAVFVAARRSVAGKIPRRLYGEDRRRLQAALRRQSATALSAPVYPGGAMKFLPAVLCAAAFGGILWVHGAFADAAFDAWLQALWPQAQTLGVSRATFDQATRGLEPDLTLPDLVLPGRPEKPPAGQPEFVQTPADYLKEPAIESLAVHGRELFDQYRAPLAAI